MKFPINTLNLLLKTTIIIIIFLLALNNICNANLSDIFNKNSSENSRHKLIDELEDIAYDKYLYNINESELNEGIILGVISKMDEYSDFFNIDEYEQFNKNINGDISGIGIEMMKHESGVKIISVIDGSPAQKAGLESGDIIVNINDIDIDKKSMFEIGKIIQGKIGTFVSLTALKEDTKISRIVVVKRDKISYETVTIEKYGKIPVVKIKIFTKNTGRQLYDALQKLKKYKPLGIVLDLRNNPGGLLESAIDIASILLPKNTPIANALYKNGNIEVIQANGKLFDIFFMKLPIVIMVNQGTASAAELISGAIIESNKGISIGTKTFGKGVIQDIIPLNSIKGTAIKITVAEYTTPNGFKINKKGLIPSIECLENSCDLFKTASGIITSYY